MPSPAPEMGPFLVGIGMVLEKSGAHVREFGAGQEVVLWWWIWNELRGVHKHERGIWGL